MKKILLIVFVYFVTSGGVDAQNSKTNLIDASENYFSLVQYVDENSKTIDTSFLKHYNRHKQWWQHRAGHDGNYQAYFDALHNYTNSSKQVKNSTWHWESLGPRYLGQEKYNIGRVNSIWINPQNSAHIRVGAASAGLWETLNGADSLPDWYCLTCNLPGGVDEFVVHPTNPDIIYGILTIHINGMYYNRGGYGIFKTTNGGQDVELILPEILSEHKGVTDICFKPGEPNTVYVLTYHSVYKLEGTQINEYAINSVGKKTTCFSI